MTTKVVIDAHAGWPVNVIVKDKGQEPRTIRVEPHTIFDIAVYDSRSIEVIEDTAAGWTPKPQAE